MNKFEYKVQGVDYEVEIEEMEGNIAKVSVNGIPFEVELKQPINPAKAITRPKVVAPVAAAAPAPAPAAKPAAAQGAGSIKIEAGAAGKVFKIEKNVGDAVKKGDTVLVLEIMKMETPVVAPEDGTVASIDVAVGDAVESGALLATLN